MTLFGFERSVIWDSFVPPQTTTDFLFSSLTAVIVISQGQDCQFNFDHSTQIILIVFKVTSASEPILFHKVQDHGAFIPQYITRWLHRWIGIFLVRAFYGHYKLCIFSFGPKTDCSLLLILHLCAEVCCKTIFGLDKSSKKYLKYLIRTKFARIAHKNLINPSDEILKL